ASQQLQGVLNDAMGQLASTDGDVVLNKVGQRLAQLQTPATAAPTRDWKKALDTQKALQQKLGDLDEAIARYQQEVDRYATLQAEHAGSQAQQPWVALRQNEATARKQLEQVQDMRDALQHKRDGLRISKQTLDL